MFKNIKVNFKTKKLFITTVTSVAILLGIGTTTVNAGGFINPPTLPTLPTQPAQPVGGFINPPTQPTQPTQPASPTTENNQFGDRIIQTGLKYLGVPYKFGSRSGVTSTFDCSSFVQQVFRENGVTLPRSSAQQATVGKPVYTLQKGDLMFFDTSKARPGIDHVGIYAGNGKVLHTWGKGGVRLDPFSGWVKATFVKAKRVR